MSRSRLALALGALFLSITAPLSASPPSDDQLLYKPEAPLNTGAPSATTPVTLQSMGPSAPVQPGSQATVEIYFQVADNSYVNHEMTRVTLTTAEGLVVGEPVFPEPHTKEVPSLGKVAKIHTGNFVVRLPVTVAANAGAGDRALDLAVRYQACDDKVCFIPKTEKSQIVLTIAPGGAAPPAVQPEVPAAQPGVPAAQPGAPGVPVQPEPRLPQGAVPPAEAAPAASLATASSAPVAPQSEFARQIERGLFWAYLFAFWFGVLASLTPCVYPMIPITMAVIGAKKARSRRESFQLSLVFVLGIALVYSLLGVVSALTGAIFGAMLQNQYVVGAISLIFAGLALGMLGFYDMNVPAPIANRLNQMGGKGYLGAFVVGMVTGVVASPCVGPLLLGILSWIATTQSVVLGFTILFVFALGMGMLFLLIGTFTGAVMSLPRSGGWMIRVKHLLGAMLFGVAWYFALPVLPVWFAPVLLGIGLVVLTTGELESARERKLTTAFMAASSTYLLLLGFNGAWPGTISTGFTSIQSVHGASAGSVKWITTEPEGLAQAVRDRKPVMIDFTADWCRACKELELYTYSDPKVAQALEGFVSVKLDGTEDDNPHFQGPFKKYGVLGLPTVLFLTPDGKVLPELTLVGFEGPEPFLERLAAARKSS